MRPVCVAITATAMILMAGCGQLFQSPAQSPPDGVRLLALTAFEADSSGQDAALRVYIQPIASDGEKRYRFELYELRPYSANPRGRRLELWPEIEPGPPASTNPRWRPHLGAYEVLLPISTLPEAGKRLVLEVTALMDDGTRRFDLLEVRVKTDN